jgi:hypothetical protein
MTNASVLTIGSFLPAASDQHQMSSSNTTHGAGTSPKDSRDARRVSGGRGGDRDNAEEGSASSSVKRSPEKRRKRSHGGQNLLSAASSEGNRGTEGNPSAFESKMILSGINWAAAFVFLTSRFRSSLLVPHPRFVMFSSLFSHCVIFSFLVAMSALARGNLPDRQQLTTHGLNPGLVGMGGNFSFFGGQDGAANHLQSLFALQNHQAAAFAAAAASGNGQQPSGGGGAGGGFSSGNFSGFGNGGGGGAGGQPTLQQQLAWRQASLLHQGFSGTVSQGLLSGPCGLLSPAMAAQAQNRTGMIGGGFPGLQSLRDSNIMIPMGSELQQLQPSDAAGEAGRNTNSANSVEKTKLSGRAPAVLYMSCDDDSLSEYQCLVRKQIELFEAGREEVESNAKGRNKPIVLGQVGIRCGHCSMLNPRHRVRGATYYPAKLNGLYQAAQSMASGHLCFHCQHIPDEIRQELLVLRERKSSAGKSISLSSEWSDFSLVSDHPCLF